MLRLSLAVVAALIAAPAMAVTTITMQSKITSFATLDSGSVAATERFRGFDSYGLAGQHLIRVILNLDASINGNVDATNNATGGNPASRRRDITAQYALTASAAGNGFNLSGSDTQSQTRTGVPGQGNTITLNQIDPSFVREASLTSGLDIFRNSVDFDVLGNAVFTSTPAANVVFGTPDIGAGRATLTLTYESAVPEPATWVALIAGLGIVGAAARRRRKTVAA